MASLWVKLVRKGRIVRQATLPIEDGAGIGAGVEAALAEACRRLDLPKPLWLTRQQREFADYRRASFNADNFVESIAFDRMEIEEVGIDRPKPPRDPRIEA